MFFRLVIGLDQNLRISSNYLTGPDQIQWIDTLGTQNQNHGYAYPELEGRDWTSAGLCVQLRDALVQVHLPWHRVLQPHLINSQHPFDASAILQVPFSSPSGKKINSWPMNESLSVHPSVSASV